jgi:hypothetical protein
MIDMGKVIFAFTVAFAANMVTWVSAIAQVDIDQYGGEALGALAIYGGLIAALKILWSEMKAERDARIAAEQRAVVIAEAMSAKARRTSHDRNRRSETTRCERKQNKKPKNTIATLMQRSTKK